MEIKLPVYYDPAIDFNGIRDEYVIKDANHNAVCRCYGRDVTNHIVDILNRDYLDPTDAGKSIYELLREIHTMMKARSSV